MRRLRIMGLLLVLSAGLAAAGCGDGLPSPAATSSNGSGGTGSGNGSSCNQCGSLVHGATPTVTVDATDQDQFSPKTTHLKVGDIVEWKNTGVQTHSVTFSDASITDPTLNGGQVFEVKFTKPGNFYYYCTFHLSLGMTGYIDVASG
jgi:plastocyanin